MQRSITLRNVCACGIAPALEALAEQASEHLGPNHPDYPTLTVLRAEKHMMPLVINLPEDLADYGLYSELPNHHNPLGKRVLEVAVRMCASCPCHDSHDLAGPGTTGGVAGRGQSYGQGPNGGRDLCHGRCHGCAKACRQELTVHIAQLPEFPFPPAEVDGFLYDYFDMPELATATVPREYRFTYTVTRQDEAPGAEAADVEVPGAAQPAQRRKAGAPPLDCNAWLYETMCALSDPRVYGHLRPEWQARYLQQVGVAPAGWDKSFREAARHYLHRILHDRGEEDAPGQDGCPTA